MCDPHLRLTRLLRERAGPGAVLVAASTQPWTSVTFGGMRHRLTFALAHDAAGRLAGLSPDRIVIPGHVLADFSVREGGSTDGVRMVECAALTLEAA